MLFNEIEWHPASLCSYESTDNSFGGSVEAVAGGGGYAGGPGADFGTATGGPDGGGSTLDGMGVGGAGFGNTGMMESRAADVGALSAMAAAGLFAGTGYSGWGAAQLAVASYIAGAYGTKPDVALGHLAHDIAVSMNWAAANSDPALAGVP